MAKGHFGYLKALLRVPQSVTSGTSKRYFGYLKALLRVGRGNASSLPKRHFNAIVPLPCRGGDRGGVTDFIRVGMLLTPPPTPPLQGRGVHMRPRSGSACACALPCSGSACACALPCSGSACACALPCMCATMFRECVCMCATMFRECVCMCVRACTIIYRCMHARTCTKLLGEFLVCC